MKEPREIFKKIECAMHSGKQLAGISCSHGSPFHNPSWSIHTSVLV